MKNGLIFTALVAFVLALSGVGFVQTNLIRTDRIANKAVTLTKIQDVANAKFLCRSTSGSGTLEQCSFGSGLSLSGGTLSATGSGGTVTSIGITPGTGISVSGSPVTSSGNITVNLANSGVSAGSCGSSTQSCVLTYDATGRITAASTATISGGGGSFVGAKAYRTSNFAWPNPISTTPNQITFDAEVFDSGTMHDTSTNTARFIALSAGKYVAGMNWTSSNSGVYMRVEVRKNSSTIIGYLGGPEYASGQIIVDLAANDYIEFWGKSSNFGSTGTGESDISGWLYKVN